MCAEGSCEIVVSLVGAPQKHASTTGPANSIIDVEILRASAVSYRASKKRLRRDTPFRRVRPDGGCAEAQCRPIRCRGARLCAPAHGTVPCSRPTGGKRARGEQPSPKEGRPDPAATGWRGGTRPDAVIGCQTSPFRWTGMRNLCIFVSQRSGKEEVECP